MYIPSFLKECSTTSASHLYVWNPAILQAYTHLPEQMLSLDAYIYFFILTLMHHIFPMKYKY